MAAEGLIGAAKAVLDGTRDLENAALKLARAALNEVIEVHEGLIQGAIDALHAAGNLSDELHLFDLAKSALKAGEAMPQGIIDTAQKGLDAHATYTEFLLSNVAESYYCSPSTKIKNSILHDTPSTSQKAL